VPTPARNKRLYEELLKEKEEGIRLLEKMNNSSN
jgi:hypothetical protein